MAAHAFTSFALRASIVAWGEKQGLISRIDQMEKFRGLRSGLLQARLPCLWMRGFPLNLGLGGLGSVRGRRVLLQGPGNSLEVLLGSEQQATVQNIGDVALRVQFDSRGHKRQRGPLGLYDGLPNNDRRMILASGDDPSLCGWRGSPNSVILLVYHLLDIEFLLVREHEVRQRAVGLLLKDFAAFLGLHGHMIGLKILAMQHLEGLHPQIISQHLVQGGFAHTRLRWPRYCSFGEGFVAALPSCFWRFEGGGHSVFFRALVGQWVFPVSWNFFTIFHTAERFLFSRYTISTLVFPPLWSLIT